MKKISRILAAAAAAAIACCMIPSPGINAQICSDMETVGDLRYRKIDEDENGDYDYIKITGCKESAVSVDIPSEIDGLPVTSISYGAFFTCADLTSINIPDSITSIGGWAFYMCRKLKSINISDSVTFIDGWAFYMCRSLESIELPESLASIESGTFRGCTSLESITILNSECEIDDNESAISDTAVIYGHKDSTAQIYAIKNKRIFANLENPERSIASDVTGDGKIDIFDAVTVAQYTVGKQSLEPEQLDISDVNRDGKINIFDASAIARFTV